MKAGTTRHELSLFSFQETLTPKDCELYERILHAWEARRRGAKNHTEASFKHDVGIVNSFITFSGVAPWNWSEEDFDEWCYFIGVEKGLAMSSQRSYQTAIRMFLKYITESHKFRDEIKKATGHYPVQICTTDNCIPHTVTREIEKDKPSFNHGEINKFFDTIDEQILECLKYEKMSNQRLKAKHSFQRDKAMFATIYAGALRASEVVLMNEFSFEEEPMSPELGDYGYMSVMGKGSKGSGKRAGVVPVTDIDYPAIIDWYLNSIRPWYLLRADPNEVALFLSERGKRISYIALRKRFNEIIDLAGLNQKNFTLHSFRRASLFHDSCNMSIQAVKEKGRHVNIETTIGYFPQKDPYVRSEYALAVRQQLQRIAGVGKAQKK
jgi:site-specific recombinase XerD